MASSSVTGDASPPPIKSRLDPSSFPEIIDEIIKHADRETRLAVRASSQACRDRVDAKLLKHVIVDNKFINKGVYAIRILDREDIRLPLIPWKSVDGQAQSDTDAQLWQRSLDEARRLKHINIVDCSNRFLWPESICFRELKHVKVIDASNSFQWPTDIYLPSLKYTRLHHTERTNQPAAESLVFFVRLFPAHLPRMYSTGANNIVTYTSPRKVVVRLLPGSFCSSSRDLGDFHPRWSQVKHLVVIAPTGFGEFPGGWKGFNQQLHQLLEMMSSSLDGPKSVTCVGLAEAFLRIARHSVKDNLDLPDVDDVLNPEFWRSTYFNPAQNVYNRVELGQLLHTLEHFNVKCVTTSKYRASLTPEDAAAELVANGALLGFRVDW
ncbi:uncharacterized protein LOC62_03G003663 [Vanrija pseudolonga]|uniref:Uncharacterized protein n=1 Tax=Vanrija pseudolonga TaxID=143232 RepID=A0AAF0Y4T7_9TREE|nr:hypothetical protein LOC62_03G003663 [Vanrija pseudolonga]